MEKTCETTMHCSGLSDQQLLSLTECRRRRCGFRFGGSPCCSRRGTKACFWFLALALPAKCWQRFVSRSKSQLCSLMLQIWVKRQAVLRWLDSQAGTGSLRLMGEQKLIRVPARSGGGGLLRQSQGWRKCKDRGGWLVLEGQFWGSETLKGHVWQSFLETVASPGNLRSTLSPQSGGANATAWLNYLSSEKQWEVTRLEIINKL